MNLTPTFRVNDDKDLILEFKERPGQVVNLSNLQMDDTNIIRIYQDRSGKTLKIKNGWWLVAEITLPGIEYKQEPLLDEKGNPILGENDEPQIKVERIPLNADNVEVKLWDMS
ncbi:MAG: hypothetical protein J7K85_07930 [Anaerolineaceae bacterium]|nr:hypothetical protein [Anaerolineaceae bacterium]